MSKTNAILFSKVDREDYWVTNGVVLRVENTDTYSDAYLEIKEKLETEEVINHIIEEGCLVDDLFDGDESFKFIKSEWNCFRLELTFQNSEGDEVNYRMSADFVYVV